MKRKHVIATFALATLLGVGVFAGMRSHGFHEAKAANGDYGILGIINGATNWDCANATYKMTDNGDNTFTYSNLTLKVDDEFKTAGKNNTDWQGWWAVRTGPTSSTVKAKFESGNGKDDGNIKCLVAGNYDITFYAGNYAVSSERYHILIEETGAVVTKYDVDVYVDGVKRGTEQITEGDLPSEPSFNYGKKFSGWFTDAACTAGNEVTAITANTTVYSKTTLDAGTVTFSIDASAVSTVFETPLKLYAWNDHNKNNAAWPGANIEDLDEVIVPDNVKVIINDGTKQTVNVETLQDNGTLKILNTKTGDNYNAQWFDEPAEDGYYVVGTKTNWKFKGATKMSAGENGNKAQLIRYQAAANEKFKVRSYISGVDTWYGASDYDVGAVAKELNIYVNGSDELYVEDYVEPDIPAEEGYYICGIDNKWRYEDALKMTNTSADGNVAYYMGLTAAVDDEIRIRSYYDSQDPKDRWANLGNGVEEYGEPAANPNENNFKFTKAGTYDIYAKYEEEVFKYYVAEHVDSYTITMTGVLFDGKTKDTTTNLADQVAYATANFEPELPVMNGYVARAAYEDENCTTAYVPKKFAADGHLYVKYTRIGAYMVGDATFTGAAGTAWSVDGGKLLPPAVNDTANNLYEGVITITGASVQSPVEVRPALYPAGGELEYPTYTMGTTYDFAAKVGNNIQFTVDGTYAVYYNKEMY